MRRWVTLFALLCCLCLSTEALGQKNGFAVNRGINVSHWLSQSGARGKARAAYFTEADVRFLAEAGFDHLRIPVDEAQLFSEDGKKQKEAFALLHNALAWRRKHHLRAIVDLHILRSHYFNGGERPLFTERKEQPRFYGLWGALSAELKRYPNDFLAYELLNEPVAEVGRAYGVPVYCGEFGCVSQAPEPDKTRWYADVVGQLERNGIGWAHWDYKGGFSVGARDKPLTAAWKILTRRATKSIPAGSSAIMVTDMPKGAKP